MLAVNSKRETNSSKPGTVSLIFREARGVGRGVRVMIGTVNLPAGLARGDGQRARGVIETVSLVYDKARGFR